MFGYTLVKKENKLLVKAKCWICGKKFYVIVRLKDRKILTKCFHSHLHKRYFLKWTYPYNKEVWDNYSKPWYKKLFMKEEVYFSKKLSKPLWLWKILGCCKFSRWIVYNIWTLFFGHAKIEYWECPKDANREDD